MTPGLRAGLVGAATLAGLLAGLATCENSLQRERVALCRRAVPALVPAETNLRILRAGTGATPDSVRIDYAVGPRPHWALCRFGSETEIVGITTDRQNLSGASLYLLKRFYLDTPDAAEADPGER